ncbi:GntR family transcriptional regulator [Streptomyces sp. IB2014 016-6]|uniref:GntR family transcriptional regulator n=1 Tax=Streptomyces sp. IB2014 016-6 TaxID=2517818 RepID=UPI0011CCB3DC|nr:GntR family transcriptional regulator [Streptomyces sp. IB2014 016-6]TXL86912.1 GntR family transcriptional regulator [Streptomyces sp. IB2014 016-6]
MTCPAPRPGALYQQVAAEIRSGISACEYTPGAPLPSEAQLIDRYGVRAVPAPAVTIERTITRSGKNFRTGHHPWQQTEAPTVYRTTITANTGPLLELAEGGALFAVDRLLTDPDTDTRGLHRTLIPFATADQVKQLTEAPDTEPEQIYAPLTKAGHTLTWHETVSARMPLPGERAALHTPDATPIIHTTRTTAPP